MYTMYAHVQLNSTSTSKLDRTVFVSFSSTLYYFIGGDNYFASWPSPLHCKLQFLFTQIINLTTLFDKNFDLLYSVHKQLRRKQLRILTYASKN